MNTGAVAATTAWPRVTILGVVLAEALVARVVSPSRHRLGMILGHAGFALGLVVVPFTWSPTTSKRSWPVHY